MKLIIYTLSLIFTLLAFTTTTAQSEAGPIQITEFNGTDTITAGQQFQGLSVGDVVNIKGQYGNIGNAQLVRVSYDVYKGDWSGLDYQVIDTVASVALSVGTIDGMIDHDFIIPMDAAVFGTINPAPAAWLIQVRVEYDPAEDTFWNIFVEVDDGLGTSVKNLAIDGLNIFPNPVGDIMVINTLDNKEKQVQIMDLTGRVLKSTYLPGNGNVATGDLNPGFYIVRVKEGDRVGTQKVIVK